MVGVVETRLEAVRGRVVVVVVVDGDGVGGVVVVVLVVVVVVVVVTSSLSSLDFDEQSHDSQHRRCLPPQPKTSNAKIPNTKNRSDKTVLLAILRDHSCG